MAFMERPDTPDVSSADLVHAMKDAVSENAASQDRVDNAEIVQMVEGKFFVAESARLTHENRWLTAYRNYRGIYGPDTQFTDTEKSRVFVKVTKTKVLAAYGQVVDVLFAGNKFPLSVEHTPVPEGVVDAVHFDPKAPPEAPKEDAKAAQMSPYGFPGDGKALAPGTTLIDLLGPLQDELEGIQNLKEGPGVTPTSITFEPAKTAATKMEKKIHDQLLEANAAKHLRYTAFESVLFGTGVLCGPFSVEKEYPKWDEDGTYAPVKKLMPMVYTCSVWDVYPDPEANTVDDLDYVIRRHKMSRSKLRALKRRPFFRGDVIEAAITSGPNYQRKWWETELEESQSVQETQRWEVLEYWGYIDADMAAELDLAIPKQMEDLDELQVSLWVCNGYVLRAVLNPFTPARIPFHFVPYEINPYSMFGIGVAENMDDTQTLMNGFMRLAVDNAVLSSNLIFEIDETNLAPGQDLKLFPGKTFRRQSGAPGQSLFAQKIPNITQETLLVFDKARQLADESTGIPSFAHGQTGVSGVGRTAAGISMLMGASSLNIKTVIKNIDDFLLMPVGKALFAWNMQFDFDKEIKGDLAVSARGVESLLKNEVRQQRLLTFLQVGGSNPTLAPHIKFNYILKEMARMMDLDPDKLVNSPEEAARQAEMMKAMGAMGDGGGGEASPSGADAMDPGGNGGGNAGVGSVPTPGEPSFSAEAPSGGVNPLQG
jgi:hypothetical protein